MRHCVKNAAGIAAPTQEDLTAQKAKAKYRRLALRLLAIGFFLLIGFCVLEFQQASDPLHSASSSFVSRIREFPSFVSYRLWANWRGEIFKSKVTMAVWIIAGLVLAQGVRKS